MRPSSWHTQRPAEHSICPQHCADEAQAAPTSAQQMGEPGEARHDAPAPHSDALVHAAASDRQVGAATHAPALQERPVLQRDPAQHACPDAPQAGATSGGGTTSGECRRSSRSSHSSIGSDQPSSRW